VAEDVAVAAEAVVEEVAEAEEEEDAVGDAEDAAVEDTARNEAGGGQLPE
jgi:hypothetical protein